MSQAGISGMIGSITQYSLTKAKAASTIKSWTVTLILTAVKSHRVIQEAVCPWFQERKAGPSGRSGKSCTCRHRRIASAWMGL